MASLKALCVFCASASGIDPAYATAANDLGEALAHRDIQLIYGGAKAGLMGIVANAALAHGGCVRGIIPRVLVELEVAHDGCTDLYTVDTMHERKAMMSELADAFLILPGGYGTLEELFEVLTWQTLRLHRKPICLVNVNGFYGGLLAFLDHCVEQGILKQRARDSLLVAETVKDALGLLEANL